MRGSRRPRGELEEENSQLRQDLSQLRDAYNALLERDEVKQRRIEMLEGTLAGLLNANTPSSAGSSVYEARKNAEKEARKEGRLPPHKKPGGRPGHKGKTRRHAPTRKEYYRLKNHTCGCGAKLRGRFKPRDIFKLIPAHVEEVRCFIEHAYCPCCKKTVSAKTDLPKRGSYDKAILGTVAELRAARLPYAAIAALLAALWHLKVSKSTVITMINRVADALSGRAKSIMKMIQKAPHVHVDETSMPSGGLTSWAWVFAYADLRAIWIRKSRGGIVVDTYLGDYDGVVISDGFAPYRRFDPGGRHQQCWSHEIRAVEHASLSHDGRLEDLLADVRSMYGIAKLASAAPSPSVRAALEQSMEKMLDRYRNSGDVYLDKAVGRLGRAAHNLFAFCEHAGVDPTNNVAERGLRDLVVRRKISGQIKGGEAAAFRLSVFLTCVLTWRLQGKSVLGEVMRAV